MKIKGITLGFSGSSVNIYVYVLVWKGPNRRSGVGDAQFSGRFHVFNLILELQIKYNFNF